MKAWVAAVFALISLAFFPLNALASGSSNVRITHVIPHDTGIVIVYVDTARTGMPACATASGVVYELDANTTAGQAVLSAIYVAFSANLPIDIGGKATCRAGSNAELIGYVAVHR